MLLNPFCPCGNSSPYATCCEPHLTGKALAPTAEALMRSRYTAYSQGHVDYLIATWYAKAGKHRDRAALIQSLQTTQWLGLTIIKTQKGQAQDKRGVVEFVALYQTISPQVRLSPGQSPGQSSGLGRGETVHQLHERSRFVQEKGHWLYVDGDTLPPIPISTSNNGKYADQCPECGVAVLCNRIVLFSRVAWRERGIRQSLLPSILNIKQANSSIT